MNSSGSESEGEAKRLSEATVGVGLPERNRDDRGSGPRKKKRRLPSKRPSSTNQGGEQQDLVSTAVQNFLATKLSQFMDSHYELVEPEEACTAGATGGIGPEESCIRLLSTSEQPVFLEPHPPPLKPRPPRFRDNLCSDSEEEEEERKRLESAAIDAQTIFDQSKKTI